MTPGMVVNELFSKFLQKETQLVRKKTEIEAVKFKWDNFRSQVLQGDTFIPNESVILPDERWHRTSKPVVLKRSATKIEVEIQIAEGIIHLIGSQNAIQANARYWQETSTMLVALW